MENWDYEFNELSIKIRNNLSIDNKKRIFDYKF
jgi:hypothetical protein